MLMKHFSYQTIFIVLMVENKYFLFHRVTVSVAGKLGSSIKGNTLSNCHRYYKIRKFEGKLGNMDRIYHILGYCSGDLCSKSARVEEQEMFKVEE